MGNIKVQTEQKEVEPINGSFVMINKDLGIESQNVKNESESKVDEENANLSIQRNTYID